MSYPISTELYKELIEEERFTVDIVNIEDKKEVNWALYAIKSAYYVKEKHWIGDHQQGNNK